MINYLSTFFKELYLSKDLLYRLVINDIKTKYLGSATGIIWNFLQPFLLISIYIFVFTYIFKLKVTSLHGAKAISSFYIISGVVPWFIIVESLSKSMVILIENGNIIKKTSFSLEVLPAQTVIVPFINYGLIIFIGGVLITLYKLDFLGLALLIFGLISLTIMLIGLSMLISVFCLVIRDIMPIIQIILNIWIYATPILYSITMLPKLFQKLMFFNPFFPIISVFQRAISGSNTVNLTIIFLTIFWSFLFFVVGLYIFERNKYELVDWL